MCYKIFLSTTNKEDLSQLSGENFRFERPADYDPKDVLGLLAFPHQWCLLGYGGGCSCMFRHAEPGFEPITMKPLAQPYFWPPEDWCPEEADDISRTAEVYDLLREMVQREYGVDLIDA